MLPLRPVRLLAPLYGSDWNAQPSGAFTSRLSTDRSPSPLLDITTTVSGPFCWRDFHPLEWQLASLHQIRTRRFPASGSSRERFVPAGVAVDDSGRWQRMTGEERVEVAARLRAQCSLRPSRRVPRQLSQAAGEPLIQISCGVTLVIASCVFKSTLNCPNHCHL